jgi:hypothetical protein
MGIDHSTTLLHTKLIQAHDTGGGAGVCNSSLHCEEKPYGILSAYTLKAEWPGESKNRRLDSHPTLFCGLPLPVWRDHWYCKVWAKKMRATSWRIGLPRFWFWGCIIRSWEFWVPTNAHVIGFRAASWDDSQDENHFSPKWDIPLAKTFPWWDGRTTIPPEPTCIRNSNAASAFKKNAIQWVFFSRRLASVVASPYWATCRYR